MRSTKLSNTELLEHVEATRLKEQQEREPFLRRFRELPEELEQQVVEAAALAAIRQREAAYTEPQMRNIHVWAEELVQCCREGIRFERWYDKNVRGL